jgi:hypothetical protein
VEALARGIPVLYKATAKLIEYSDSEGVRVHTDTAGVLAADAVVVTTPLGALKEGRPAFSPPLPGWKADAIRRLGFGLLNKVWEAGGVGRGVGGRGLFGAVDGGLRARRAHATGQRHRETTARREFGPTPPFSRVPPHPSPP